MVDGGLMRWSPAIPAVSPITDRSSIFLRYLALGLCNFGKGCRPHHAHPKLVKSLAYQSLGIKKEAKCRNLYYFGERDGEFGCYFQGVLSLISAAEKSVIAMFWATVNAE